MQEYLKKVNWDNVEGGYSIPDAAAQKPEELKADIPDYIKAEESISYLYENGYAPPQIKRGRKKKSEQKGKEEQEEEEEESADEDFVAPEKGEGEEKEEENIQSEKEEESEEGEESEEEEKSESE